MATFQTAARPEVAPAQIAADDQSALDCFSKMYGRMKGAMTIVDDLVARDPELWNCTRE